MTGARPGPAWTALLAGLASCAGESTPPVDVTGPRHVVVVSMDTTRADYFGCMGNERVHTPRVDALAEEGILFTDYMQAAPSTLVSHTTLFTGTYPTTHGVPRNGALVHPDNHLLSEVLRDAGFRTAAFVGAFPVAAQFGLSQGFEVYDDELGERNERPASEVVDRALAYLDDADPRERHFLFLHVFDPHVPHEVEADVAELYGLEELSVSEEELVRARQSLTDGEAVPELVERLERIYAAEVTTVDRELGRLVDRLRANGMLDDALLVLTTDHGEDLDDHPPYFHHGSTTFQATIQGFLLVRLPGAELGGTRVDELVGSIDVFPTVLALLDLPLPGRVDGEAVDPHTPGSIGERTRFAQATQPRVRASQGGKWVNSSLATCVRRGRFKYVLVPHSGRELLFDLAADPREENDLLEGGSVIERDRAAMLRREIERWTAEADPLPFIRDADDEVGRRLSELGYAGD